MLDQSLPQPDMMPLCVNVNSTELAGVRQFASAGPAPLSRGCLRPQGAIISQTAPVPQPRSQPSSVCLTCASLFVFPRLLDVADDIELWRRRSSIHAR